MKKRRVASSPAAADGTPTRDVPPPDEAALRRRYALLKNQCERALAQLRARTDEHNAFAAFATAAMRSPITGHVYLRGDTVLMRNPRFREMNESEGGPWRTSDGPKLATLTAVVRAQSRDLWTSARLRSWRAHPL